MPRQTPQHRILPVGKIKACEQVLHPHLPALFSLPLSRPLGSPTWLGWGEARSTASRARILQGTWVLLTMWRPQQGAPIHCRHRACGPADPWAPHLIHIPLPRARKLHSYEADVSLTNTHILQKCHTVVYIYELQM